MKPTILFETETFNKECSKIVKSSIFPFMEEKMKELYEKINDEIKNNVSKNISKDLYNYSTIKEVKNEFEWFYFVNGIQKNNKGTLKQYVDDILEVGMGSSEGFFNKQPYELEKNTIYTRKEKHILFYEKFHKNEKIVILDKCSNTEQIISPNYIFITNYGRIYMCGIHQGSKDENCYLCTLDTFECDFWIPIDYIFLIQRMFELVNSGKVLTADHSASNFNRFIPNVNYIEDKFVFKFMCNLLREIKEQFYGRKYMPSYVIEIEEENKQMKEQFIMYEENKKKLEDEKQKFEMQIKPYVDIQKEKKELEELKHKLKLVSIKLETDKQNFEKEKEEFNKMVAEYKTINISDVLE
jgi:hypothetical protein